LEAKVPEHTQSTTAAVPTLQFDFDNLAAAVADAAAAGCMPPPPMRHSGKNTFAILRTSKGDAAISCSPSSGQQLTGVLSLDAPQLQQQSLPLPLIISSSKVTTLCPETAGDASTPAAVEMAAAEAEDSCQAGYSCRDLLMAQQLVHLLQLMFEERQQRQREWYQTEMATHGELEQQVGAQRLQIQALQHHMAELSGSLVATLEATTTVCQPQ
jgi:hypothetical protein